MKSGFTSVWCRKYFDILNRFGVNHRTGVMDGQTDRTIAISFVERRALKARKYTVHYSERPTNHGIKDYSGIQAFVSCRIEYCNSLLYDVSDGLAEKLRSVQNAATLSVTELDGAITSCYINCTGFLSSDE